MEKLEYGQDLTIEQAETKFYEVKSQYDKIYSKYRGIKRLFRKNLSEKDLKGLEECVSVLLPLSHTDSLQSNKSQKVSIRDIGTLSMDILSFISEFKGSGVKRIIDKEYVA